MGEVKFLEDVLQDVESLAIEVGYAQQQLERWKCGMRALDAVHRAAELVVSLRKTCSAQRVVAECCRTTSREAALKYSATPGARPDPQATLAEIAFVVRDLEANYGLLGDRNVRLVSAEDFVATVNCLKDAYVLLSEGIP